jgi:hypothetical protein
MARRHADPDLEIGHALPRPPEGLAAPDTDAVRLGSGQGTAAFALASMLSMAAFSCRARSSKVYVDRWLIIDVDRSELSSSFSRRETAKVTPGCLGETIMDRLARSSLKLTSNSRAPGSSEVRSFSIDARMASGVSRSTLGRRLAGRRIDSTVASAVTLTMVRSAKFSPNDGIWRRPSTIWISQATTGVPTATRP